MAFPEVQHILCLRVGPDIADLGGSTRPPASQKHAGRGGGGEAPHPFRWALGRQGADWTPNKLAISWPTVKHKKSWTFGLGPLLIHSAELSHSLKVSERRGNAPESGQNRSESLCAVL